MDHTTNTGAVGAIPWRWRILIYAISILGFGNVAMCTWLPAKLRTASIVYHGFFLVVYVFNMIIFLVKLRLSGPLNLMTGKLLYLVIVICGSSLCAWNLWATVMKRPYICFQTWAKCIIGQKKKSIEAFILYIAPLFTVILAITSCFYHADLMLANSHILMDYLFPYSSVGEKIKHVMFWMAVIIRELTTLASSLYSALACCIMIEIYLCVTALHQDLLTICKKQHLLQTELQIWRRKVGYLDKIVKSVNCYLGGSVLVLLIISVSSLILGIFQPIAEENVELGLLLPLCNTIVLMTALTVPSAILNGKVTTYISRLVPLIARFMEPT